MTFSYKEGGSGKSKHCTLTAEAFLHRFLHHILPKGFVKVRYYGLFAAGNRPLLQQVRRLLTSAALPLPALPSLLPTAPVRPVQPQAATCPKCGQVMQWRYTCQPQNRSPPVVTAP